MTEKVLVIDDSDRLVDALKRMIQLLEDPHPGLHTWHLACERTAREVENELARARRGGRV